MLQPIRAKLSPVRMRQRLARAIRWGTYGVMAGAFLGSVCVLLNWIGVATNSVHVWMACVATILASLVGSQLWPVSWQSSAQLVDTAYDLKDATLTALEFATRTSNDPLRRLQIQDTMQQLGSLDASRVVPWTAPRWAPAAISALGVMLALSLFAWPPSVSVANVPPGPLDVVLDQAALLEETMVEDLQRLAGDLKDPELEELAETMKQAVDELKEPQVDQREALANLSEMQAKLSAALKQLDVQQIDAQLQQLAEALQVADATQAASQALRESKYDKAAEQLEKIDASTMSHKQRDAVASNLAKLASTLGQGKNGQLGEAIQEMLDGLENDSLSQCKAGFCKAAGVCRSQSLKKRISECLACQLNRLSACKGRCQGACNNPNSVVAKSETPSNKAGRGVSNQPTGDQQTQLDSRRRDEELTGIAGEGPSERETLSTAEARQDAARAYRERYVEFRKRMEEVLDNEPLPLGHRETVRKYFELIRPTSDESEAISGSLQ